MGTLRSQAAPPGRAVASPGGPVALLERRVSSLGRPVASSERPVPSLERHVTSALTSCGNKVGVRSLLDPFLHTFWMNVVSVLGSILYPKSFLLFPQVGSSRYSCDCHDPGYDSILRRNPVT